jgi:hypothetical protein
MGPEFESSINDIPDVSSVDKLSVLAGMSERHASTGTCHKEGASECERIEAEVGREVEMQ